MVLIGEAGQKEEGQAWALESWKWLRGLRGAGQAEAWARLIRKVFEVGPLLCHGCGGWMKIIALIDDLPLVRRVMEELDLREEQEPLPLPLENEAAGSVEEIGKCQPMSNKVMVSWG